MHKLFSNKINLLILLITLWSSATFAQVDNDPGGIDGDPGQNVPIDHWIPLMLFLGAAIIFFYNRKRSPLQYN